VTIELYKDGQRVDTTATNPLTGCFTFPDLPSGTYTVKVVVEPGDDLYFSPEGGDSNVDATGQGNIIVSSGELNPSDFKAGLFKGVTATGSIWDDLDGDGIKDPGEPPLAGATIAVLDDVDAVVRTVTTGEDGFYSATMPPGNYKGAITPPTDSDDYMLSPKNGRGSKFNPDTMMTELLDLSTPGQAVGTFDAGFYKAVTMKLELSHLGLTVCIPLALSQVPTMLSLLHLPIML